MEKILKIETFQIINAIKANEFENLARKSSNFSRTAIVPNCECTMYTKLTFNAQHDFRFTCGECVRDRNIEYPVAKLILSWQPINICACIIACATCDAQS